MREFGKRNQPAAKERRSASRNLQKGTQGRVSTGNATVAMKLLKPFSNHE
jgi:hypothetical protein